MFTLVTPMLLDRNEDVLVLTELEHSEQESEGKNFPSNGTTPPLATAWNFSRDRTSGTARGVNIDLHERLDASRLLNPPDARIGLA